MVCFKRVRERGTEGWNISSNKMLMVLFWRKKYWIIVGLDLSVWGFLKSQSIRTCDRKATILSTLLPSSKRLQDYGKTPPQCGRKSTGRNVVKEHCGIHGYCCGHLLHVPGYYSPKACGNIFIKTGKALPFICGILRRHNLYLIIHSRTLSIQRKGC